MLQYVNKSVASQTLPKSSPKYRRKDWKHWTDDDGDCRNTRHEVLAETSTVPVQYTSDGCRVTTGRWVGPYSGRVFHKAAHLDIDHLVPLKEAHLSGGYKWSPAQKRKFANDRRRFHLLPVQRALNRSKGAKDPARWMPPKRRSRCAYIFHWISIKKRYGLNFDSREAAFLRSTYRAECRRPPA